MNNKPPIKSNSLKYAPAALVSSQNERFMLFQDVNIIGRNENAFICLPDSSISRKHCVITQTDDNKFTICDTSLSGTFVNNKRLVKNRIQTLQHKDKISLSGLDKYIYIFFWNKSVDLSADQSEQLNSQMQEKMLNLDNSHSMELKKLNQELNKIESEKSELQEEMKSKLEAQEIIFKKERESLTNLVTYTSEQQEKAEAKLTQMKENFMEEKKILKEEIQNKIAKMDEKEKELQQLKFDMEKQHQLERNELEKKFTAEVLDLKLKLAMSEMEQDRLQEETREAKLQLAESKQVLLESEIEQTRLADEKVEVETKLTSTIIDLTNEKDNVVRDLEKKLKEKENEQERVRKEIEGLEEHLMCSICTELFIEPTVLNCGHMFCKACIEEWKTKKKICPMCRAKMTGCVQVFNLDAIIEKNVAMLSTEAKEHRDSVIRKRKSPPPKPVKKKKQRIARVPSQILESHDNPTRVPMVQIGENYLIQLGQGLNRRLNNQDDMIDPFAWHGPQQNHPTPFEWMGPLEATVPMAAIDLTNVIEAPVQRTTNSTATSTSTSGLIDLTVTP